MLAMKAGSWADLQDSRLLPHTRLASPRCYLQQFIYKHLFIILLHLLCLPWLLLVLPFLHTSCAVVRIVLPFLIIWLCCLSCIILVLPFLYTCCTAFSCIVPVLPFLHTSCVVVLTVLPFLIICLCCLSCIILVLPFLYTFCAAFSCIVPCSCLSCTVPVLWYLVYCIAFLDHFSVLPILHKPCAAFLVYFLCCPTCTLPVLPFLITTCAAFIAYLHGGAPGTYCDVFLDNFSGHNSCAAFFVHLLCCLSCTFPELPFLHTSFAAYRSRAITFMPTARAEFRT